MSDLKTYARFRWGALLVSLSAWIVLLAERDSPELCSPLRAGGGWSSPDGSDLRTIAQGHGLMAVAMLAPLLVAPLSFVYQSSFARLRLRLMTLCALGYLALWTAAGVILVAGERFIAAGSSGSWWPALLVGTAALVWQASPWKKACLNRCHRHRPVAAFGLPAHWDAFCVGAEQGFWCVGSCWLNMSWPMLLPAGRSVAMIAIALLMACERLDPGARPAWRLRGFGTALAYLGWLRRRARSRDWAEGAQPV